MLRRTSNSSTSVRLIPRRYCSCLRRLGRIGLIGAGIAAILVAGPVAPRQASADIGQVDVGTYSDTSPNNAPAQVQDYNFTVSPGANVLVVDLFWRTGTQITAANAP